MSEYMFAKETLRDIKRRRERLKIVRDKINNSPEGSEERGALSAEWLVINDTLEELLPKEKKARKAIFRYWLRTAIDNTVIGLIGLLIFGGSLWLCVLIVLALHNLAFPEGGC